MVDQPPRAYRFAMILAGAVFLAEALIMSLLFALPTLPYWVYPLLDASLLIVILLPLLYRLMLHPMITQISRREAAQLQLSSSNRELRAMTAAERSQRALAEALTEATVALNSSLDLDNVLDRIMEQILRIVPGSVVAILLLEDGWVKVPRIRGDLVGTPLVNGFAIDMFPRLQVSAETLSSILARDTRSDADWSDPPGLEWVRSFVLAPLVEEKRTIGFLATLSETPDFFGTEKRDLLATFAAHAAVAIRHANVYQAELHARQLAETLSAASLALTQTLEVQTVLDLLLSFLQRLIPYDAGSVALLESETEIVVRARAHSGGLPAMQSAVPDKLDLLEHPTLRALLDSQQGALVGGATGAAWSLGPAGSEGPSLLAVPVVAGGTTLGLCVLERDEPHGFMLDQVHLAEAMVGQAAVAVQNAWLFQQVRAGHDRMQSLSHRLVEVQETERHSVARELHDEAGQMLASLMLRLKLLEAEAADPSSVVEGVNDLRTIANTVQENLHRLAMDLRPASLDHLGLAAALSTLVYRVQDHDGIDVQFKTVGGSEGRLPPEFEVSIYRIAQEALTNVVRHAQAAHVDVLLQRDHESIILTVEDDGIGFDTSAASSRLGLVGMRERCDMLGGQFVVESTPGGGTTLVAEIPYANSNTDM